MSFSINIPGYNRAINVENEKDIFGNETYSSMVRTPFGEIVCIRTYIDEYDYSDLHHMFNNISFTANPISSSDAIVLFLANQSEWAKEYVEKMLEEQEWSLKHIRRQVSIERYKEQKLAEYKKTPSEDLIQAKLFHDSVPKSGQVKVTLDIDGKQFVGSFDSKFFGYTGANLDEAILPEAGFKYPDSFEGYYEFLKDNGINIECKDGMFPFTFVKEIAAFRGDKIFWKREA